MVPSLVPPSFSEDRSSVDGVFAVSSSSLLPSQIESQLSTPYDATGGSPGAHDGHMHYNPGASGHTAARYCDDQPIPRFRNGFLQGIQVQQGSLGAGNSETLSMHHVSLQANTAIPLGSADHVLLVSPNFRADLLHAPATMDLPDALYETGVRFLWRRPINETFNSLIVFTPAVRSDFSTSQDALRIFGVAMLTWEKIPDELTLSAGVIYLDRADLLALPAVGILWTPTPRWKVDIQFPQPRVSYRVAKNGQQSESWVYGVGGFGGNTWAVTRSGGVSDQLTISDLRMMVGFERIFAGNKAWFGEAGIAFARTYEYQQLNVENTLDAATLFRLGITF